MFGVTDVLFDLVYFSVDVDNKIKVGFVFSILVLVSGALGECGTTCSMC